MSQFPSMARGTILGNGPWMLALWLGAAQRVSLLKHRLDLFSPETYHRFSSSDRTVAGVKARYRKLASEVAPGDLLLGYVTRLSRWCGVLEATSAAYEDGTPRFVDSDDPYTIRFRVEPKVWLPA